MYHIFHNDIPLVSKTIFIKYAKFQFSDIKGYYNWHIKFQFYINLIYLFINILISYICIGFIYTNKLFKSNSNNKFCR